MWLKSFAQYYYSISNNFSSASFGVRFPSGWNKHTQVTACGEKYLFTLCILYLRRNVSVLMTHSVKSPPLKFYTSIKAIKSSEPLVNLCWGPRNTEGFWERWERSDQIAGLPFTTVKKFICIFGTHTFQMESVSVLSRFCWSKDKNCLWESAAWSKVEYLPGNPLAFTEESCSSRIYSCTRSP